MGYSMEELKIKQSCGRSFLIGIRDRRKITEYRMYYQTPAGEFEVETWENLMLEAIDKAGENVLFEELKEYAKKLPWLKNSKAIQNYALELHSGRIFDDPQWVGYIKFNRKCRPEALAGVPIISIWTDCCSCAGEITESMYLRDKEKTACPTCGRLVPYRILDI